ncbi:MAG: DUF3822 family protein [Bacteroidales bacterium]|nr:DUF3822 family protein [Bacteroidales bacterium]
MPNIHTEYNFREENSSLPIHIKKAIAIQDYSFFFIAFSEDKIEYALHAGVHPEKTEDCINELKTYLIDKFGNEVFDGCKIQILSKRFSLIPEGLFSKEEYPAALDYLYTEEQQYEIMESPVPTASSILISENSSPLFVATKTILPHQNIYDIAAVWLNKILSLNQTSACFVHLFSQSFLIAIVHENKLQLFNSFNFSAKNDFLYFLLGSIQCTGLRNEDTKLHISGEISPSAPLMEQISYYFAEVKFLQKSFPQNPESTKISHLFYSLIEN